ncbi:hypothetical protein HMPREF3229_00561 [Peptoniphilus harei]|uniref:Uncharacterized protein n=1 Tax=Peptoniphilus harei TaxID=54005 RepID=A0A133PQN8_9FIRM|nr:hypothetical protein HMPREF3229_00561 [Peptoniphilus harei]
MYVLPLIKNFSYIYYNIRTKNYKGSLLIRRRMNTFYDKKNLFY